MALIELSETFRIARPHASPPFNTYVSGTRPRLQAIVPPQTSRG
jgi:hypothetical protein